METIDEKREEGRSVGLPAVSALGSKVSVDGADSEAFLARSFSAVR